MANLSAKRSSDEISKEESREEELEVALSLWLVKRQKVSKIRENLQKEIEGIKELEKKYPIIGNVKGLLKKSSQKALPVEEENAESPEVQAPATGTPATPTKGKSTKARLEDKMTQISNKNKKFKPDSGFANSSKHKGVMTQELE